MTVYIQTEPPIDLSSLTCWRQWLAEDGIEELLAATTTATNCHDSKPLLSLLDKADIQASVRVHTDKTYSSQKPRDVLKARGIKNGLQDKAAKNKPLLKRQLQRDRLITRARYVVERTFGSQAQWLNAKYCVIECQILRYRGQGACLAHATGYNLKGYLNSLLSGE